MPNQRSAEITRTYIKSLNSYYRSLIKKPHPVAPSKEGYIEKKMKVVFPLSMQEYVEHNIKFVHEDFEEYDLNACQPSSGAIMQCLRNQERYETELRVKYQKMYQDAYKIKRAEYEKEWQALYAKNESVVDSKAQGDAVKSQKLQAERTGASLCVPAKPAVNLPTVKPMTNPPVLNAALKELSTDNCPDKVKMLKDKEGNDTENEFQPGLPKMVG